jgi:hypothetical protein
MFCDQGRHWVWAPPQHLAKRWTQG